MSINNETIGNISTIIKYASMLITGWTISILANHGLNIQGQEQYLTELITIILFFVLAHVDAKYKKCFFLFLRLLRCFSSPGSPATVMYWL